jgi:hypothetical protein
MNGKHLIPSASAAAVSPCLPSRNLSPSALAPGLGTLCGCVRRREFPQGPQGVRHA